MEATRWVSRDCDYDRHKVAVWQLKPRWNWEKGWWYWGDREWVDPAVMDAEAFKLAFGWVPEPGECYEYVSTWP